MRKLSALLLAMSALALVVIWMPGRDSEHQLAVVTGIAGKGFARVQSPSDRFQFIPERTASAEQPGGERRPRTFSPDMPLVPADRTAPARATAAKEAPPATADARSASATSTGELRVASSVKQPAPPAATRLTSTAPTDEAGRFELIRNLQRELKRVGCYWGEIDGSWGGGSKRAMGAFTERVNATLPIDQPDYILLSLVQGYAGQACGMGCPTGQSLSDGRCTPNVVLAQTTKRAPSRSEPSPAPTRAADNSWAAGTQVTPAPTYGTIASTEPLPGRMAIGGPRAGGTPPLDPSGLTPPYRSSSPSAADEPPGPQSVDYGRQVRTGSRPVVIYRSVRPANYYRPAARTASRRLTFGDVFR